MRGIDVSAHQKDIDFAKVKASGIEFVILRIGYAQTLDSKFNENVAKCREVGLPILGVYLFSYALNAEDAAAEARFCLSQLDFDPIIFYDFEYDTVTYAAKMGVTLGPDHCNLFAETFCERIKDAGKKPGIYYNLDYYLYWYRHDLLDKYIKWFADPSGVPDYPCDYHQYSATGQVDGIVGDVDMDYYYEQEDNMEFKDLTDTQVDELLNRINKRLADLPVSTFAKESSEKGVASGLFSDGDKNGLVDNPQGFLRRQEFATLLNRAGILDQIIAIKK